MSFFKFITLILVSLSLIACEKSTTQEAATNNSEKTTINDANDDNDANRIQAETESVSENETENDSTDNEVQATSNMNELGADLSSKMEIKLPDYSLSVPDMSEIYADGEKYLAWFAKRDRVQQSDSGLLYRILEQGNGPKPTRESIVEVHYRGTFPDGEVFDSSYRDNKPMIHPASQFISGWTEALLMMNEGTKMEIVVPPELAYGERGIGDVIPPNSVLKFEMELLRADVDPKELKK